MTWLPGFTPANSAIKGGSFTDEPPRFTLHTTEGFSADPLYQASVHPYPPHLWVTFPSHPFRPRMRIQIIDLDRSASALAHPAGTPETNRASARQVEIEGFAANMLHATDEDLDWLAHEVIGPCCEATGVPVGTYLDSTTGRLTWAAWAAFSGLHGHMHVPGNDHVDPGHLNITRLSQLLTGTAPAPEPTPHQEDDEMSVIAHDGRDGAIYHVAGAWKVHLKNERQVSILAFLGAKFIPDADGDWLDAFATTQHATDDPDTLSGKTVDEITKMIVAAQAKTLTPQ